LNPKERGKDVKQKEWKGRRHSDKLYLSRTFRDEKKPRPSDQKKGRLEGGGQKAGGEKKWENGNEGGSVKSVGPLVLFEADRDVHRSKRTEVVTWPQKREEEKANNSEEGEGN